MVRKFATELADVVGSVELLRKDAVNTLLCVNNMDDELADATFLKMLTTLKALNVQIQDLRRHVEEAKASG